MHHACLRPLPQRTGRLSQGGLVWDSSCPSPQKEVDVQVPPSHAEGRRIGGVAPGKSQGFPRRFAVPLIPTLRPFRVRRPGSPPRMRNHNMSALDTHGNTVFSRTFRTPPKRAPRKEPGKWFMNPHRHCRFLVCWDAKGAKCSGFPMGFRMVNGIRSPCAVSGPTPRILRVRISPFLARWPAQGGVRYFRVSRPPPGLLVV